MRKELVIVLVVGAAAAAFFAGRAMDRSPEPAQAPAESTAQEPTAQEPAAPPPASPPAAAAGAEAAGAKASAATAVSRHPSRGPEDARVTVLEITDFQCPFCTRGRMTLEEVRKAYEGDLRIITIHLPLDFHEHARFAAVASMAAHRQGRFWAMADALFAGQKQLSKASVRKAAEDLGLDMARFDKDLADPELGEQVSDDMAIANSLGVAGTPAYFINGVKISGSQPREKFEAIIKQQLARADELLRNGTPRSKLHDRLWRRNNPAMADAVVDWVIRGRKPPESARPKPQTKDPNPPPKAKPKEKPQHPAKDKTIWRATLRGDEPIQGPATAPITAVLFTDFQCPFCARVRPALAQLRKSYGKRLRLVFKNKPLSFHKRAPLAAEAGLCAHAQGRFWPMEERLFTHQQQLTRDELIAHAKAVGLDVKRFTRCLDQHDKRPTLRADEDLAARLGVNGTPTVFINGRRVGGAQPFGVYARIVDQELSRAEALRKAGTGPKALYAKAIEGGKANEVQPELDPKAVSLDLSGAPRLGLPTAPIRIVAFEDLQCPYCARVGDELAVVRKQLGGKVAVYFKHLPLSNQCNPTMGRDMHPAACIAATWAIAAQQQDRFWGFSKRVFADMRGLMPADGPLDKRLLVASENLAKHAQAAGVDVDKARKFIASGGYRTVLERDMHEAAAHKVRGTPSLFINGHAYNGPLNAERIIAAARTAEKLPRLPAKPGPAQPAAP